MLLAWRPQPLTGPRLARLTAQAAIFSFVLLCRTSTVWLLAMALSFAVGLCAIDFTSHRRLRWDPSISRRLIPAAMATAIVALGFGAVRANTDELYAKQPVSHLFWHPILIGLIQNSETLLGKYTRSPHKQGPDQIGYDAVMLYLRERNDASSAIAFRRNGELIVRPSVAWNEYEVLARSVVIEIAQQYPFEALRSLIMNVPYQWRLFRDAGLGPQMLAMPVAIAALLAWVAASAGAFSVRGQNLWLGVLEFAYVSVFALIPALIFPSLSNVGVLLCFFMCGALIASFAVDWALGNCGTLPRGAHCQASSEGKARGTTTKK